GGKHPQGRRQRIRRPAQVQPDRGFRARQGRRAGRAAPQAARDPQQAPRPPAQGGPLRRSRSPPRKGHAEHRRDGQTERGPGREEAGGGKIPMSSPEQAPAAAPAATTTEKAAPSILDQVIGATKQTEKSRAEDLVRTLAEEVMKGTVTYSKNV